jgi:hypothetical protein
MILEIWILEKDIEQLKKLCIAWLSCKDKEDQSIRYSTIPPQGEKEWICVHIPLNDYTVLKDNNLIKKV